MSAFHDLDGYFLITEAIVSASNYWNVIHGEKPVEIHQDTEGMQIMRVLGRGIAWVMKLIDHGKGTVAKPESEQKQRLNFIH